MFCINVPKGYGKLGSETIPNITETDEPKKICTSGFDDGKEIW